MEQRPKLNPLDNAFIDFLESQGFKPVDVTPYECKRCGLLKSTVEANGTKCIPDVRMGTTLEGVHDFIININK